MTVLDAPEGEYALAARRRQTAASARQTLGSPEELLRRDLHENFASDPYEEDDAPMVRRRGGVRVRFGGIPRNRKGWIAAGVLLLLCMGVCAGTAIMARDFLLHDGHFVIPSATAIAFEGNEHVTRSQLLSVFGADVERNIFRVPLAGRKAELEQIPWVAHATVMRLLPNRVRVSIVERTPVAFVREGNHIGLVDASGVLLDMPVQTKENAHYSFPVVTGISANDPVSTRAARMKTFARFTSDLDSSGENISQGLSEVDLSNPEDVKALIPDHSIDVLVHFGETDFLDRYRRFEAHLPEWRTVYPKLSSVDMRYDRQVVLEMQPGSGVPMTSSRNADASVASADPGAALAAPRGKTPAKSLVGTATPAAVRRAVGPKSRLTSKTPVHRASVSVTKSRPTVAAARHHPVVVRHAPGTALYHPPQAVRP